MTGQLGYDIANKKLKSTPTPAIQQRHLERLVRRLSLQYSMRYLSTHVKDFGFPEFVNRLTPVVEMAWSSSASQPNNLRPFLWGVGVNYPPELRRRRRDVDPGTAHRLPPGRHRQFHLYFDDLFPNSLGKPIVDWFKS